MCQCAKYENEAAMMKKITFCIVATALILMIVGDCWNVYARKSNQLKIYQEEIANQREEIRGLEDTMNQLFDRLDVYEAAWDILRGTDSTSVNGLIQYIWKVREAQQYYNDDFEPIDSDIKTSQTVIV